MVRKDALGELEGQLRSVPPESIKHDLEAGFEAMTRWIENQDPVHRLEVIQALPRWYSDGEEWHARAALEITLQLRSAQLLGHAIEEAERQGIHDIPAPLQYPAWLEFQLNLIRVLANWGPHLPATGIAYLTGLRKQASNADSYSRRLLSIRAWISLCYIQNDFSCLRDAVLRVRRWSDQRLQMSALTLIHAYFGRGDANGQLTGIFTPEELKVVRPSPLK